MTPAEVEREIAERRRVALEQAIARARQAWRPPSSAETRHLRALHEILRCSFKLTRHPRERLGWVKTTLERVIGDLLGEHVRLPERDVRQALEAMGFRVRGDRVWCAQLPWTSAKFSDLVTPELRASLTRHTKGTP